MEQVFFRLHSQTSRSILRRTSHSVRERAEQFLLLLAVASFCLVCLLHSVFVVRRNGGPNVSCLKGWEGWERNDTNGSGGGRNEIGMRGTEIVRVVVGRRTREGGRRYPAVYGAKWPGGIQTEGKRNRWIESRTTPDSTPQMCTNTSESGITDNENNNTYLNDTTINAAIAGSDHTNNYFCDIAFRRENEGDDDNDVNLTSSVLLPPISDEDVQYIFSKTKGFLMLDESIWDRYNIATANLYISYDDTRCFGDPFLQSVVSNLVRPSTVIQNWFLSPNGGYLLDARNGDVFDLSPMPLRSYLDGGASHGYDDAKTTTTMATTHLQWGQRFRHLVSSPLLNVRFILFKSGVLCATLFLFFLTTTLVSFTLRETQERMLTFTYQLHHHVRNRMPHAQLIFGHVVESLVFAPIMVGSTFFLFEFFGDKLLAFMVLSVVWVCEVYSVISMRTYCTMQFFPRVFFLYFTLFHVYFFSCPFGFTYLALNSTVLFLAHSMLFFWNRYELPALRAGLVSSTVPRMAGVPSGVPRSGGFLGRVGGGDGLGLMQTMPSMSSLGGASANSARGERTSQDYNSNLDITDSDVQQQHMTSSMMVGDPSHPHLSNGGVALHRSNQNTISTEPGHSNEILDRHTTMAPDIRVDRHHLQELPLLPSSPIIPTRLQETQLPDHMDTDLPETPRRSGSTGRVQSVTYGEQPQQERPLVASASSSALNISTYTHSPNLADDLSVPLLGSYAFSFWNWRGNIQLAVESDYINGDDYHHGVLRDRSAHSGNSTYEEN